MAFQTARLGCVLIAVLLAAGCDRQASRLADDWAAQSIAMGRFDDALLFCDTAIELNPRNPESFAYRAMTWVRKAQHVRAATDVQEAPARAAAAVVLHQQYARAVADFQEAIRLDPNGEDALKTYNGLAWMRATCREARFRDGPEAIKLATQACEATGWQSAAIVDTLAAAYAEQGDFASAVRWQTRAIELADERLKGELTPRLALYKEEKPYRE